MSTAHRPTWDPAVGKSDSKHLTKNFSAKSMAAHTRLKFRQPAQKDGHSTDRRDLKAQLEKAEKDARNKKRKEQGLQPEEEDKEELVDEREQKRLKLVEASRLDRDDDDDDQDHDHSNGNGNGNLEKGKGKAVNPE